MGVFKYATNDLEEIELLFNDPDVEIERIFNTQIAWQQENSVVRIADGPCPEIKEQIERWTKDAGGACDWIEEWKVAKKRVLKDGLDESLKEAFVREKRDNDARRQADEVVTTVEDDTVGEPETSEKDSEPEMMNDAVVLGKDHPDLYDFIDTPTNLAVGQLYGAKDHRNTRDNKWKNRELTWFQWLNEGGLSKHPVAKEKGGDSIVPAKLLDGKRTDAAVETMYAVGIDIDSGTKLTHVVDKLVEAGYFALVYTTFNHLKTTLELKHDAVVKTMKLDDTPTRTQIQEYLRLHHKDRYDYDFISKIKVINAREHTSDGLMIILETPAIDKFRVILPLAEPVHLSDLAPTMQGWKEVWADAVTGVAVNMLDADFDASCSDVNRLFYTPRHPKGGEFYSAIVMGKPLPFDEIEPSSKEQYVRSRKATGDPFTYDDGGQKEVESYQTPSGMSLNDWHKKLKDRFLIADVLETFASDKLRSAGGEKVGTVHLECPFEHEHSTHGGTATMAMNPDECESGYWTIFCRHDACSGRHKLEFLQQMLADEWFDESVLTDESFVLPPSDQDEDTLLASMAAGPISDFSSGAIATALADASISEDSNDADIETFLLRCVAGDADNSARARVGNHIAAVTSLGKRQINNLWAKIDKEKASKNATQSEKESLDVNMGFDPLLHVAKDLICEANDESSFLFEYTGAPAILRCRPDGSPRIKVLNVNGLSEAISHKVKFKKWIASSETYVSAPPPKEIVAHLIEADLGSFTLPLRGIAEAPFFDAKAQLVCEQGYNEGAQVILAMRDGLNPPRVSAVPSADDVARARDLFESLFGDFLLGGMIRSDGQTAEYANAIGLALLPFCRDMIDGPIPAHLINKPSAGEGAGLLIDVIATIWTGQVATAMDYPPRKEEIGKTILAKLRSGAPYLLFDNIPVTIDSSALAIAITQGWMDGRILGRTDAGAVDPIEVRSPMIFTGIDVKTSEEIRRRMVLIGLESGEVSPEKRTGPKPGTAWRHTNLKKWARENRSDLVWACLTLVQNWIARGRQPYDAPQAKGSFEEWQRVIGGILRDAGIEYFGANEDALNKATSDALTDGVAVLTSAIAAYPVGTYFSIGSQEDGSGIMDLLNKGPDGNPISISKWGYKEEDGTYGSAVSIGKHFSSFALKPHRTKRLSAGRLIDVEIKLDQCEDPRNKTKRYRLKMRVPGSEWIESEDDPAWAEIS